MTGKKSIITVILVLLVFSSVFARSFSGEGYGATLNDAKANALSELLSKIKVNVYSITRTGVSGSSEGTYQTYAQNTSITTDISLMFVRYDVSPSATKQEKASGKYKCIASISDADKEQCISRASGLVSDIERIYEAYAEETDLRVKVAYSDVLETRFNEYESCLLTAEILGYGSEIPAYSGFINPEKIRIDSTRAKEELLRAGLSGSMTDTTTDGLVNALLNSLWESKTDSVSQLAVRSSVSDGVYSKIYKVGDFGPAGGIIFYDKGEFSDGWRFLEVASEDIPGTFTYGRNGKLSTKTSLGSGKENTAQILALNGWSGASYAALACSEYESGGYSDWYLPSKEELEMIYKRLKSNKNLTMDKAAYWTSSQLNSSYAYGFSLKTRKSFTDSRSVGFKVRAVRSF